MTRGFYPPKTRHRNWTVNQDFFNGTTGRQISKDKANLDSSSLDSRLTPKDIMRAYDISSPLKNRNQAAVKALEKGILPAK